MTTSHHMEFEKEIERLEAQIQAHRFEDRGDSKEIMRQIGALEREIRRRLKKIYSGLTPWQTCLVARHPERPFALDHIGGVFSGFIEVHGDRAFSDDRSIVAGYAWLDDSPVTVIGHQKGRTTDEKIERNFGMPHPEGYRKALRVMRTAERFRLPIVTLIDTPGAYPGIGAEERGQSEAIARNLLEMAGLRTPVVSVVIGEGGSGGALALAAGDMALMLEHSVYSVISPEGASSILWKNAEHAPEAATGMGITAKQLKGLKLIDGIVPEPVGGAHRDPAGTFAAVRDAVGDALQALAKFDEDALLERRRARWRQYGTWKQRRG